jgi:hypothetical protein
MRRRLITDHISSPFHPSLYTIVDPEGKRREKVDLNYVRVLVENDPLWAERGKAIQSYALLEQALSMLFANLSGTTEVVAATIFYKITSSGARTAIIEKLLHQKHQSKYNPFWNSYKKQLKPVDTKRNEIVHWVCAVIAKLNDDGITTCGLILIPPNVHSFFPEMTFVSISDLVDFPSKCDVFSRLCNIFRRVIQDDKEQISFDAWLDIFQKPLIYPLPQHHLLYKMPSIS